MSKLRKAHKMLKRYGFNVVKAQKIKKSIMKLDYEVMSFTDDESRYFANRNKAWKLVDQLVKLEVI